MTGETLGDQIDRYLLGRLADPDRERLEARMFEDRAVWTAIRDAEDDLIERYVAGELSAADRADFEGHFAVSASRRERVEFARSLPRALASVPGMARAAKPAPPRTMRPWLGVAAALLVAAVWLGRAWSTGPAGATTPLVGATTPVPAAAPPLGSFAPAVSPPAAAADSASGDLILRGALVRGADGQTMPRLAQPREADVRIDVALEGAAGTTGVAVLETVEGTAIWKGSARLAEDGRTARVVVPGSILRAGDYLLRVAPGDADGASGRTSEYAFRVIARPR